ncbi:MAG: hypothetical protein RL173_2705 [Fibrobacterota bacterium]|jgi:AhpD family alkylhydroperoxidase
MRLDMGTVCPEVYSALSNLDKTFASSSVPLRERELMKVRASQINGCAFCVNSHSRTALGAGESEARLRMLPVWRHSGAFSAREQLLLRLVEELTEISKTGLSEATYRNCIETLGERGTAEMVALVVSINAWNRIGAGLEMVPDLV